MEYVKRLSNKEAAKSGEPAGGEGPYQTALRSVKRTLGLWERSAHQLAKPIGVIGKESVDPDFEAPAQFRQRVDRIRIHGESLGVRDIDPRRVGEPEPGIESLGTNRPGAL